MMDGSGVASEKTSGGSRRGRLARLDSGTIVPARRRVPRGATALPEVGLRGIGIHAMCLAECTQHVMRELDHGRGGWAILTTLDHLVRGKRDAEYRAMVEEADLRVPVGTLLYWACGLQRTPLPERVAGQDFLLSLCDEAAARGRSVFLLGGRPGSVDKAAEILRARQPELVVAGTECPAPGFESDPIAMAKLSRKIEAAGPDLVLVSLDSPLQESVIRFLRHDNPEAWWIGIGDGLFLVTGESREAPRWMGDAGLEWIYRLAHEPSRLFASYVVRCLPYGCLLLFSSTLRGTLPIGKRVGSYGVRLPSALVVDDDPHALDQLEILLTSRFPDLEVETRTEPDVSGKYDFYFLDNDFEGKDLAASLAGRVRAEHPSSLVFGFSGTLDVPTLKRLINAGCDGVCDKGEPRSVKPILELMERRMEAMRKRHAVHALGGVRGAAASIRELLADWNERDAATRSRARRTDLPEVPEVNR